MLQFNVSDIIWYHKNKYFVLLRTDFPRNTQFILQNFRNFWASFNIKVTVAWYRLR